MDLLVQGWPAAGVSRKEIALLAEVAALPMQARAKLARQLLESFEGAPDDEWTRVRLAELEKCETRHIETGTRRGEPRRARPRRRPGSASRKLNYFKTSY